MATRTFTREQLESWGVPNAYDADGTPAKRLYEEQIDTRRWVSVHELVFVAPDDNRTWCVVYEEGLTESQEGTDPWDYEDQITAQEMEQYEVTVTRYRAVPKGI